MFVKKLLNENLRFSFKVYFTIDHKVNKSVYVAKLGQLYDKTLNNFFLHVPNQA